MELINIQILEHLSKPETLCIIHPPRVNIVDIHYSCISLIALRNFQVLLEALNGISRTVKVLFIACCPPCVKIGFEDFRSKDIVRSRDIETMLLIKQQIVAGGSCVPCVIPIVRDKGKYFRPYPSPGVEKY